MHMRKLLTLAVALALALPTASRAQFSLGARIGFAPSMGDAFKDANTGEPLKMSDGVKSQIPIQIEGAYKATKEIAVGAYFSYGIGQTGGAAKADCSANGQSCSASDVRLGIQAFYSFTQVSPQFVPWLGLGLGYEWGSFEESGGGQPTVSTTFKGWEFLNLQAGGDYQVSPQFSVGPYVMLSIAQYSTAEFESGGITVSGDIDNKTIHEWIGFGIRGKFDF
jgi:outer membrane protein W